MIISSAWTLVMIISSAWTSKTIKEELEPLVKRVVRFGLNKSKLYQGRRKFGVPKSRGLFQSI